MQFFQILFIDILTSCINLGKSEKFFAYSALNERAMLEISCVGLSFPSKLKQYVSKFL